jgi:hypothetical protein
MRTRSTEPARTLIPAATSEGHLRKQVALFAWSTDAAISPAARAPTTTCSACSRNNPSFSIGVAPPLGQTCILRMRMSVGERYRVTRRRPAAVGANPAPL